MSPFLWSTINVSIDKRGEEGVTKSRAGILEIAAECVRCCDGHIPLSSQTLLIINLRFPPKLSSWIWYTATNIEYSSWQPDNVILIMLQDHMSTPVFYCSTKQNISADVFMLKTLCYYSNAGSQSWLDNVNLLNVFCVGIHKNGCSTASSIWQWFCTLISDNAMLCYKCHTSSIDRLTTQLSSLKRNSWEISDDVCTL